MEKNRVGRSVKNYFFHYCFGHVLCMFYVDWEFGGRKKLKGRDF